MDIKCISWGWTAKPSPRTLCRKSRRRVVDLSTANPSIRSCPTAPRRKLAFKDDPDSCPSHSCDSPAAAVGVVKWDEMSPRDAVPVISPLKAAALAAAAAQERSQRAEVRGRPEWWGPRAKTSTQRMLRLRPADPAPPGGESQHSDDASQNDKPGEQFIRCDDIGLWNGRSFATMLDDMSKYQYR